MNVVFKQNIIQLNSVLDVVASILKGHACFELPFFFFFLDTYADAFSFFF